MPASLQHGDTRPEHLKVQATFEKDTTHHAGEALMELYKRLRQGDLPTLDSARTLIESLLFNPHRDDPAKVGRNTVNQNLWERSRADCRPQAPRDTVRVLLPRDTVRMVKQMIQRKA